MTEEYELISKQLIRADEGYRQFPYKCTAGKLSVGYGRNLDDVGVSREEAEMMLQSDWEEALEICRVLPNWNTLNHVRKAVLLNMAYCLKYKILKFKKMIQDLSALNFTGVAIEILDSKFGKSDAPKRAQRLAEMMRLGVL